MAQSPLFKPFVIAIRVEKTPSTEDLITNPNVTQPLFLPNNVVLIIGESHSKSHSSLYGYEKKTNPKLDSISKRGNLFIFNNVRSADTRTVGAFHKMMSTYDDGSSQKWYQHDNIFNILNNVGIQTAWISNQESNGVYANTISCYSTLCHKAKFIEQETGNFDGDVLKYLMTDIDTPLFEVIHLMGSHESFNQRYPKEYDIFKPENYHEKPENQHKLLAHYDNSLIYNDWVISQIIDAYKDKESIVIYFPDHGLDLFESSSDYIGHAKHMSKKSVDVATQVPFIVFVSDKFIEKYPQLTDVIRANRSVTFNLTDLVYAIMDLYGMDFVSEEPSNAVHLFR